MASDYSVEVCRELEANVRAVNLYRPMRVSRYDAGTELIYDVRPTLCRNGDGRSVEGVLRKESQGPPSNRGQDTRDTDGAHPAC